MSSPHDDRRWAARARRAAPLYSSSQARDAGRRASAQVL
ncbi:hypothetical protein C7S17_6155 [Burkholderia thailandensis]|nr:hypothetical protein [Burkholderia thailandensis]